MNAEFDEKLNIHHNVRVSRMTAYTSLGFIPLAFTHAFVQTEYDAVFSVNFWDGRIFYKTCFCTVFSIWSSWLNFK